MLTKNIGARDEKLDLVHCSLKVYKVGLYRAFDCAFRFARKKRSVFPWCYLATNRE